jgi:hypothetical protein
MAKRHKHGAHDAGGIQPGIGKHLFRLGMVDKGIRQHQGPHLQAIIEQAFMRQELQNVAGKATDSAFFDRHQNLVLAGETADQILVQGLGETRIGNGGGKPGRSQFLGCQQAVVQARAE